MQPLRPLPELSPTGAVWRGAVTALLIALPAGIVNQFVVDSDGSSVVVLVLWIVIMFGAVTGGYAVLRLAPSAGLPHAAAAGALAYAAVQLLGVIRRLASGEPISWVAYPFLAMLMAIMAMFGGMYARRVVRRYAPNSSGPAGEDR